MGEHWPTYTATVTREDGLWVAVVAELSPAATDVEHFDEIKPAVRDLIGGLTDTNPESGEFWVQWKLVQNDRDYTPVIEQLEAAELEADRATVERDAVRRAAIQGMRRAGLSLRDIADVVGMSHQRVHQLANEHHGFDGAEIDSLMTMNPDPGAFEVGLAHARRDRAYSLTEIQAALSRSLAQPETAEALSSIRMSLPTADLLNLLKGLRASLAGAALELPESISLPSINFHLFPPPDAELLDAFEYWDRNADEISRQPWFYNDMEIREAVLRYRAEHPRSIATNAGFAEGSAVALDAPALIENHASVGATAGVREMDERDAHDAEVIPFPAVLFALATESNLETIDDISLIREVLRRLTAAKGPTERRARRTMIDLLDKLGAEAAEKHA